MRRTAGLAAATVAAALVSAGSAHAVTHTTDYKTNIANYRICDPIELDSCEFADVLSPSQYYLADGKKITVIYTDAGVVQMKIDAATIKLDDYISYSCANENFTCKETNANYCDAPPGGNQTQSCVRNRCTGGTNAGAACTVDSQCPGGGECSGSTNCVYQVCQDGPQDGHFCGTGGGTVSCTSTNNVPNFTVRITGNETGGHLVWSSVLYYLRGNVSTGEGCVLTCDVDLGSDGSINSSALSCASTGDCTTAPIETIHSVELLDPTGAILGISGVGPARLTDFSGPVTNSGDPAMHGDCIRNPSQNPCP